MTEIEGYPPGWLHGTVHFNPGSGEIHSENPALRQELLDYPLREVERRAGATREEMLNWIRFEDRTDAQSQDKAAHLADWLRRIIEGGGK